MKTFPFCSDGPPCIIPHCFRLNHFPVQFPYTNFPDGSQNHSEDIIVPTTAPTAPPLSSLPKLRRSPASLFPSANSSTRFFFYWCEKRTFSGHFFKPLLFCSLRTPAGRFYMCYGVPLRSSVGTLWPRDLFRFLSLFLLLIRLPPWLVLDP